MTQYKTIAESNNFIVLDKYNKYYDEKEANIAAVLIRKAMKNPTI